MLVRRCMKNDLRPIAFKNLPHPLLIPNRADQCFQRKFRTASPQFLLNTISVVLINVKNYKPFYRMVRDLPAQFAADRPSAARDQNCFAVEEGANAFQIHLHRLTAQQIFDLYITDRLHNDFAVGDLIQSR